MLGGEISSMNTELAHKYPSEVAMSKVVDKSLQDLWLLSSGEPVCSGSQESQLRDQPSRVLEGTFLLFTVNDNISHL